MMSPTKSKFTNTSNHHRAHSTTAVLMAIGLAITLSLSGYFLLNLKSEFHQHHTPNTPLFPTDIAPPIYQQQKDKRRIQNDLIRIKPLVVSMEGTGVDRKGYVIEEWGTKSHGHIFDHSFDGDDYRDTYYAVDDDFVKFPNCRRVSWHRYIFPNCNTFHESSMFDAKGISHGHYRNVLKIEDEFSGEIVFKVLRTERGYDFINYEYVKNDALVMERLTSSPRIVDMYGHCGSSIIQEALVADVESLIVPGSGYLKHNRTLNDKHDVDPQNDFTPRQKLSLALMLAEPIADLHGFQDGVIVHDDIQLCQFLYDKQNNLKLNDFNRAEIMLWNQQQQQYCKYHNGKVWGNYRSPEEVDDRPLNEKIDVFSYGNMIYNLLTGLWNYYTMTDDQEVQNLVSKGQQAYIDARYRNHSFEESVLVKVVERCWKHDVGKRADIFEIVGILREAVKKSNSM